MFLCWDVDASSFLTHEPMGCLRQLRSHGADLILAGFHIHTFMTAARGAFPFACSACGALPNHAVLSQTPSSAREEQKGAWQQST